MDMFERTFAMFAPFARRESQGGEAVPTDPALGAASSSGDITDLKRQLEEMQRKVDKLTGSD
jgi:polyhydroxyalkanoate synthesis regulator protein